MQFLNQLLEFAQDERIITDIDNQRGLPNHPEYREHRHDHSILSLLSKKYRLRAHRDPSQWGNHVADKYPPLQIRTVNPVHQKLQNQLKTFYFTKGDSSRSF